MLVQPQHGSIRGRGLVRVRGGGFCRCGRVGARGRRANGGSGVGAHAIPRVANQPVTWSDSTDFENPNVNKLFHENEELGRLSILAGTPLDCLQLFFSDEVFKSIVEQSNRYHEQQSKNGIGDRWKDIIIAEMKAFMGILLAMGLVELPKFHDYWARNAVYTLPWFSNSTHSDRFLQILACLHLFNNQEQPAREHPEYKLFKLGNLPQLLNEVFAKQYKPNQNLSVHEQMVGTRCRVQFIQYTPKKPKKFRIKLWVICEGDTGYSLRYQLYASKLDQEQENGLAHRVLFDLAENYLDKGYRIYLDNFYSTVKFFQDLENRQTYGCGTIRSDRGRFPASFK